MQNTVTVAILIKNKNTLIERKAKDSTLFDYVISIGNDILSVLIVFKITKYFFKDFVGLI